MFFQAILSDLFTNIFFKKLVCYADQYMVATPEMRMVCNLARARRTKSNPWMVDMLVPPSSVPRGPGASDDDIKFTAAVLEEFSNITLKIRTMAFTQVAQNVGALSLPIALCNIGQRPSFNASITPYAPTLLKRSILFDCVSQQEVLPVQWFLIQGMPLPEICNTAECPFPGLFEQDARGGWHCTLADDAIKGLFGQQLSYGGCGQHHLVRSCSDGHTSLRLAPDRSSHQMSPLTQSL